MAYTDTFSGAQIAAHAAYSQATAGNLIAEAILNLAHVTRNWLGARKAQRELRLLDAHLLKDIGLDETDIHAKPAESFIGQHPRYF